MIKVEHTRTHTTGQHPKFCDVLVTDAELVLVDIPKGRMCKIIFKDNLGNHILGAPNNDAFIYFDDNEQIIQPFEPILVSKTEKIEVGDFMYCKDLDGKFYIKQCILIKDNHYYTLNENEGGYGIVFKILALPEHFSPQQLQMIVDGKLKDGNKVLVECENFETGRFKPQSSLPSGEVIQLIKLNPHITIYPVIEDKMYTKDEVKKLISRAFSSDLINSQSASELDVWIDQNVK